MTISATAKKEITGANKDMSYNPLWKAIRKIFYLYFPITIVCLLTKCLLMGNPEAVDSCLLVCMIARPHVTCSTLCSFT